MSHVTAIVLAAGASTRMGEENKLLLPFRGKPLLGSVIEAVCGSPIDDVVVVTGHQDRQIRDALDKYPIRIAYNPEYESGMASSIRRGLIACSPNTNGYAVCLGDMPFVTSESIRRLRETFDSQDEPRIIVAACRGRRSHPVVLHREFRSDLMTLKGDDGVKPVLDTNPDEVIEVDIRDEALVADIDTPEAYDEVRSL